MKRNIKNRMTGKPKNEGYSRGMYRTHIQLDQYELNDQLKMTKKKEVSLLFIIDDRTAGSYLVRYGSTYHVHVPNQIISYQNFVPKSRTTDRTK